MPLRRIAVKNPLERNEAVVGIERVQLYPANHDRQRAFGPILEQDGVERHFIASGQVAQFEDAVLGEDALCQDPIVVRCPHPGEKPELAFAFEKWLPIVTDPDFLQDDKLFLGLRLVT